jgi:6-phosphogluconolactonase
MPARTLMPVVLLLSSVTGLGCEGSVTGGNAGPADATVTDGTTVDVGVEPSPAEDTMVEETMQDVPAEVPAGDTRPETPTPVGTPYVYLGLGGGKIALLDWDPTSGKLTPKERFDAGRNPSFLAFHPDRRVLYAVNEADPGRVRAFSIEPGTGRLNELEKDVTTPSEGAGPAHISVDGAGKNVLVANYGGGTVAAIKIDGDGSLGGKGSSAGDLPKAHSIKEAPGGGFVYAPILDRDGVAQFSFDRDRGQLTPLVPPILKLNDGAGPRHLSFHPTKPWVVVVNEKSDSIDVLERDLANGKLSRKFGPISTLPSGADGGANTCADVHVHPSGKFVYASNRGHDSIAVFSLDDTGRPTLIENVPTGGRTPRNFTLDGAGNRMLVANQGSRDVTSFRIDPATGRLTKLETLSIDDAPAFVGIVVVPPR